MKTSVQSIVRAVVIKNIVITGIVISSGIAGGLAVGIILGKMLSDQAYVFDTPIDTGLEADYEGLMQRYNDNSDVANFKPNEVVNISWLKYASEEHTHSVAHCNVTAAIVKQKVCSHDVRDGNRWYSESVFYSSIKKGGFRFYQNDNGVSQFKASNPKENCTATWPKESQYDYTKQEFEDKWGKTVDRPLIYVISEKTILNEKMETKDGKWYIELDLDPKKSTGRYSRQMIAMSNLEQPPSFDSINLKFTIDMNYNLERLEAHEHYTVYVVGKNESDSVNVIDYYHNSSETIPDLETDYEY